MSKKKIKRLSENSTAADIDEYFAALKDALHELKVMLKEVHDLAVETGLMESRQPLPVISAAPDVSPEKWQEILDSLGGDK